MSKLYKGIVVAANSKAGVVAAFSDVATGKNARFMASESGAVFATNGIAYDPCGYGTVRDFDGVEDMEFASASAEAEANLTVCLDGCQNFILSESQLQRCPSCSAALTASEEDIHDLVFGSESDALLQGSDPLFCGTEEQAAAFARALRTGIVPSLSGELATLNYDPYSGQESVRSCSNVAEFSGVFHKFKCAAGCSHPVTLSTSADIVFCAHCNAPLEEPENMIKKIGRIDQRLHVFAPSVSGALNGLRDLLINGAAGANHFDHKNPDENFISNSACAFNPYTGNNVASRVVDSLSGTGAEIAHDALNIHLFKCHDGCGFMACSSADANFCSECDAPLVEPSEEDLADLPAADTVGDDSSLEDLESDLAELDADEEDLLSASGEEEEFEDEEEEDLEFDDGDEGDFDESSLSGDDYDDEDEGDDMPDFDDEDDEEEDEEDEESDFEAEGDFSLESTSGDEGGEDGGEDTDTMLTDDELAELDFEGEDDDMESESSVISISAAEALVADAEFNLDSLSCVFDGKSRYHAIYDNLPLGSLNLTALSAALGDEDKAKVLFRNGTLPSILSASARENGLEQALTDLGFTPVEFNVSVSNVLQQRASKSADERADRLQNEINTIVADTTERYQASVSTAMIGLTRGFWKQDDNAVASALVNKMVASGMSLSSAREMVTSAFAEQGAELMATVFSRAQSLSAMSVEGYNEVSRAIEDINVASVSSGAVEIGKVVRKPADATNTEVKIASNSSDALAWEQKMAALGLK